MDDNSEPRLNSASFMCFHHNEMFIRDPDLRYVGRIVEEQIQNPNKLSYNRLLKIVEKYKSVCKIYYQMPSVYDFESSLKITYNDNSIKPLIEVLQLRVECNLFLEHTIDEAILVNEALLLTRLKPMMKNKNELTSNSAPKPTLDPRLEPTPQSALISILENAFDDGIGDNLIPLNDEVNQLANFQSTDLDDVQVEVVGDEDDDESEGDNDDDLVLDHECLSNDDDELMEIRAKVIQFANSDKGKQKEHVKEKEKETNEQKKEGKQKDTKKGKEKCKDSLQVVDEDKEDLYYDSDGNDSCHC